MFRTELTPAPAQSVISHRDHCISLGSCFAQMVGHRLTKYKFNSVTNPLGILFNPHSLHKLIQWAFHDSPISNERSVELHGRYVHYDFHSDIHAESLEGLSERISNGMMELRENLTECSWLIITYGTSVVHKLNSEPVANCHKQPAKHFERLLLDEDQMLEEAVASLNILKAANSKVKVILTVSPVRHIKDTLQVNGISKALLRSLCHRLSRKYEWVEYFPAYEIMLDDLRDYRFYAEDMIHPSAAAEDYIWEKFGKSYFSTETLGLNKRWEAVNKSIRHRPFNPDSPDHQKFLQDTLAKMEQLAHDLPLSKEIRALKTRMHDA